MFPNLSQTIPSSILIIITITTLTFFTTTTSVLAQDNEQYTTCDTARLDCNGKFQDIGYPFWGQGRPKFCGHPQFELNCNGDAPKITMDSTDYRVLDIDPNQVILTVVRTDYFDNACPDNFRNSTLNSTFFPYAPGTQNLTLFYKCPSAGLMGISLNQFNCTEEIGFTNYYATEFLIRTASNLNLVNQLCEDIVVVHISESAAGNLNTAAIGLDRLSNEIKKGFGIEWNASNSMCDECRNSEGRCGSDNTTEEFRCYCKDGPYPDRCVSSNSNSPTDSGTFPKRNRIIAIVATVFGILIFSVGIVCYCKRECISSKARDFWKKEKGDDFDVEAFIRNYGSFAPKRYSYATVNKMTSSFAQKIGTGGFGAVFKGKLPDGRLVAVKLLNESKSNGEEFINEVASIGRTSHVNIVTLIGFCYERKKRALVYEYMPNGSLDNFIFNKESLNADCRLEWKTLYEIAIGIARGLEYLHRGCNTRILHLDIKPQNILLDENFCPKISDFGLAKLWLRKESVVSMVGARGTIGYIAPEVFSRSFGGVSHKSDVYSYGMLVLEIIGGRKNFDSAVSHTSEIYYPNRIYKDLEMGTEASILGTITDEEKELSMKMILVSFWCIQTNPSDRPAMNKVVDMLEGSLQSIEIPPKPYLFSPTRSPQHSTGLLL